MSKLAKVSFAARHPWDDRFWAVFLATSWLAIAMGFWGPIARRFGGHANYEAPLILILHVWTYFGWMVLLTIQALLINRRQVGLHRKLGFAGAALAVLVAGSGLFAEVFSQRFWARHDPENVRFFTFSLFVIIAFSVCAFLAIRARGNPPAHKRLMLLATIAVLDGPYQRWWGATIDRMTGSGAFNTWAHLLSGWIRCWLRSPFMIWSRAARYTVSFASRYHCW